MTEYTYDKFLTCKITELNDHPSASKLKVALVYDGTSNYKVVCGAKNIRLGMFTILAQIGAKTINGTIIQESTIRGILSQGMLCSPLELGLSQEQGIIDLPPTTILGVEMGKIEKNLLSSTPWWNYKLIERFYSNPKSNAIMVQRDQLNSATSDKIILSETYWFNGSYHYRQF